MGSWLGTNELREHPCRTLVSQGIQKHKGLAWGLSEWGDKMGGASQ